MTWNRENITNQELSGYVSQILLAVHLYPQEVQEHVGKKGQKFHWCTYVHPNSTCYE